MQIERDVCQIKRIRAQLPHALILQRSKSPLQAKRGQRPSVGGVILTLSGENREFSWPNAELSSLESKHVDTNKAGHCNRARFPWVHDASVMQLWGSWSHIQLLIAHCLFDMAKTDRNKNPAKPNLHIFFSSFKKTFSLWFFSQWIWTSAPSRSSL